ncbi:MAG: RNA polymerase sigma factor [Chloroflexota bacterium]|nr:RNA polymerase sigma factor [Chloroflexota bacterium]MDQ3690875.1 RNA polymerase sigma factor [Chloroflexota bacterium]
MPLRGAGVPRIGLDDFGAFYERNYARAFRTAFAIVGERSIAEDVTQDAFVAAFRGRDRYRAGSTPETWLLRIVVNKAIDHERRRRRITMLPIVGETSPISDDDHRTVDRLDLQNLLGRLGSTQRAAVVLHYLNDLDYRAVAVVMDTSVGNVGALLSRARAELRRHLEMDAEAEARRR